MHTRLLILDIKSPTKKWLSYCTRYERGHFALRVVGEVEEHIFFKLLYSPNFFVQSSKFEQLAQFIKIDLTYN